MTDEPKTEKLTDEQHQARAMLMGRWYAPLAHSYYSRDGEPRHICADILEPMTPDEVGMRVSKRMRDGR